MAMLPAMMVGLCVPFLLLIGLNPHVLLRLHVLVVVVLSALFVVAGLLYVIAVGTPKQLIRATFDSKRRVVVLIHANPFVHAASEVPFAEIAHVVQHTYRDEAGFPSLESQLQLRSGETIALPAGVTREHLATMQAILAAR